MQEEDGGEVMVYELMYYDHIGQGLVFERYPFFWLARLRARLLPRHTYVSITRGRYDIIWRSEGVKKG